MNLNPWFEIHNDTQVLLLYNTPVSWQSISRCDNRERLLFSHQNPPKLSWVCERSAHYSKPAAKHFPGRRRRRRMALVSPCPLGDVPHPTSIQKLTLKITKSVKCENPDSCCAPSAKECFSLLSFPPLPTTHLTLGELLPPSTSIQRN